MLTPPVLSNHYITDDGDLGGDLGDPWSLFGPFTQRSLSLERNVELSCVHELFISDSVHF